MDPTREPDRAQAQLREHPGPGSHTPSVRSIIGSVVRAFGPEIRSWIQAAVTLLPGEVGIRVRIRWWRLRGAVIGERCRLGTGFTVHHPAGLSMGARVEANGMLINAQGGVTIGDDCLIAEGVKIWSINHRFADPNLCIADQGYSHEPVSIGRDVWIASNSVVLPGIAIGDGAVVAAGSVVTKDVAPVTIVAGVPARPIGVRSMKKSGSHAAITPADPE